MVVRIPAAAPRYLSNLENPQAVLAAELDWSGVTQEQLDRLETWRLAVDDPRAVSLALGRYDDLFIGRMGLEDTLLALFGKADDPAALADLVRPLLRGKHGNPHWPNQKTKQVANAILAALEGVELDYATAEAMLAENKRKYEAYGARIKRLERERQIRAASAPPPDEPVPDLNAIRARFEAEAAPPPEPPPPPPRTVDEINASLDALIAATWPAAPLDEAAPAPALPQGN